MNNLLLESLLKLAVFVQRFLLCVIAPYIPNLQARLTFEKKTQNDPSFGSQNRQAFCGFEVSSVGELEQIYSLLTEFLEQGKLVELIFCSPSVKEDVLKLKKQYPDNLRIMVLPLVTNPDKLKQWLTAPILCLCRYDFFPHLILAGKNRRFCLLSASLIGKNKISWFRKELFRKFDFIVASTLEDQKKIINFCSLPLKKVDYYNFRTDRIEQRIKNAPQTLEAHPLYHKLKSWLARFEKEETLILGSFWESDLPILDHSLIKEKIKTRKLAILILPHNLKDSEKLIEQINKMGFVCDHLENLGPKTEVILFKVSGILSELYTLFHVAYVGGGFGFHIHSLWEPHLAGNFIIHGPKFHRSSEHQDIVKVFPHSLKVLNIHQDFGNYLQDFMLTKNLDEKILKYWKECNSNRNISSRIFSYD